MDGSTPIVVTPRSVVFTDAERLLKSAEDDGNQSYKAKADTLLSKLQSAQQSDRKLYSRIRQTGDLPTREQRRVHVLERRFSLTRAADRMDTLFFDTAHLHKVDGVTVADDAKELYQELSQWLDTDDQLRMEIAKHANTYWEAVTDANYVPHESDAILDLVPFGTKRTGLTWRRRPTSDIATAIVNASLFHQSRIDSMVGLVLGDKQTTSESANLEENVKAIFAVSDSFESNKITFPDEPDAAKFWKAGLASIQGHTKRLRDAKGMSYADQKALYGDVVNAVKLFTQTGLVPTLRSMSSNYPMSPQPRPDSADRSHWTVSVVSK